MNIIIKKYGSDNKLPAFKPHFNSATDRYYHTSKDYYSDLKKKGLEPYRPSDVKPPKGKEYKPSEWAKGMYSQINSASKNGKFVPGDRFITELKKKGVDFSPKGRAEAAKKYSNYDPNKGGFKNG